VTQTCSRRRGRRTSARPRCRPTFIGGRIAAMRDRSTRTGPDPHATTRRTATPSPARFGKPRMEGPERSRSDPEAAAARVMAGASRPHARFEKVGGGADAERQRNAPCTG
jgi:hypothetical protein